MAYVISEVYRYKNQQVTLGLRWWLPMRGARDVTRSVGCARPRRSKR